MALRDTIRLSFTDMLSMAHLDAKVDSPTHARLADYVLDLTDARRPTTARFTAFAFGCFEKTVQAVRLDPDTFREFLAPRQLTFAQAAHFVAALEARLPGEEAPKKRRLEEEELAFSCETPKRQCAPVWHCS